MKDLLSLLSSTFTGETISRLMEVYDDLSSLQDKFQKEFHVSCIPSCGECCEHYIPYLTEAEAFVAAYVIIRDKREDEILTRLNTSDSTSSICPLYNKDSEFHCFLYEGRSMVCRLFGYAVSEDKEQRMTWKPCKWKEGKGEKITLDELKLHECVVPIMSRFGEKLEECGGIEGESIYSALPKAIWKLKMLLEMTTSNPA